MRALWMWYWWLLVLLAASQPAWSRSFPFTPDVTADAQQRWGSSSAGYISEGCWLAVGSGTTVTVQPCRAFALESDGDGIPSLKGFGEVTARSVTLAGGDGRYWLAGRTSPGLTAPGWTCVDGVHYCWVKSDTPPDPPAGLVLLAQTVLTSGGVGRPTIMAPWRRSTPYSVPAGVQLVLGVCPEGTRRRLWHADGVSTGTIRFGPGACGQVAPEWWGADPLGLADSTSAWQQTIDAVSGLDPAVAQVPIGCAGVYKITQPLTVRPRLQIQGHYKTQATGDKQVGCQFEWHGGAADLFVGPEIGQSYHDLDFRHLRLVDVSGTGDKAFNLRLPSGLTMENLAVQGFQTPYYINGQVIYSKLSMLQARLYRERCLEITATANFADISVVCSASAGTAVTHGVRVGFEPGLFGTSTNLTLRASVEAASGLPIQLGRVRGINAELYVEQPGACSDYSTLGAVYAQSLEGGRIHLTLTGNCSGGPPGIVRGILLDVGGLPNNNTNSLTLTGRIHDNYTVPLQINPGEGIWGIDITGLDLALPKAVLGSFTTGTKVGGNYWTHGGAPLANEGRGSTVAGTQWEVGDLIWNQGGANESANLFWQVVVAGNPPEVSRVLLPSTTAVTALAGNATPSVRRGNTYHTVMLVEGGAEPITMLDNALGGLCVELRALGTRTIDHTAPGLRLSAAYTMQAGNTLRLCADDSTGPWREMSRCATCVP